MGHKMGNKQSITYREERDAGIVERIKIRREVRAQKLLRRDWLLEYLADPKNIFTIDRRNKNAELKKLERSIALDPEREKKDVIKLYLVQRRREDREKIIQIKLRYRDLD